MLHQFEVGYHRNNTIKCLSIKNPKYVQNIYSLALQNAFSFSLYGQSILFFDVLRCYITIQYIYVFWS